MLAPETEALVAEIEGYEKFDFSADPKVSLAKMQDLLARAEAHAGLPLAARAAVANLMGTAVFYTQDYAGAAEWMGRSAALYEEAGGPADLAAEVRANQGVVLAELGRFDEAEQAQLAALALRKQLFGERHSEIAESLYNLGNVYFRQGRFEESIAAMREGAAQKSEFSPEQHNKIVTYLTGLATVLNNAGHDVEAIAVARRAEAIAREHLGDTHQLYSIALNNLGTNLNTLARYGESIPVLREALRVRQATVGEAHPWTAYSLRNLAYALAALGQLDEAQELNERALAILTAHPGQLEPIAFSTIYGALATIAAQREDWDTYDRRIASTIEQVNTKLPPTHPDRAYTHVFHASILEQRGMRSEALTIAEEWVPVLQSKLIPQHRNRIWGELLLARLRQAQGRPAEEVWPIAENAVKQLAAKLSNIAATERELVGEAETNRKSSQLYFEMAIAANDPERVFEAVQLVNISGLALGQQHTSEEAAAESSGAGTARRRLLDLARRESELDRRYAAALGAQDEARAAALGAELASAREARAAADADLRREFPDFVARYRPAPVALADLRASLADREVLVMPIEAAGRGWAVTLDRARGLAWKEFDGAQLAAHATAVRRAVDQAANLSQFPLADAAALYRMILPDGVPEGGKVLVHGGNLLASLPLALMLTDDWSGDLSNAPWLVRRASVQVLGNLTLYARGREHSRVLRGAIRMAGVGGADLPQAEPAATADGLQLAGLFRSGRPAIDSIGGLPPLPNAAQELRAIAAALPGDDDLILVGPDAAEENLKRADLSQARVLAFATHGLVSGELRGLWEPALLVGTVEGSGEDGLLGASEIARLKLDADWVILSACNTAAGDDAGTPAYSGLASAFAQAGARSLMLSHWRVRDDAAAKLSVGTVRGAAAGLPRAEALRQAQLALMADRSVPDAGHPAIWAPFVIVEN